MPQQTVSRASSAADLREAERLEALGRFDLLDAPRDETFDQAARLIEKALDVPIAMVSVIDAHRQLLLAGEGVDFDEAARRDTFCTYTIARGQPMIVADATQDQRFKDNPFVTGAPNLRAYAGVPLTTRDGHAIGTVCALDTKARDFSPREIGILGDVAAMVIDHVELRELANTDALTGALSRRAFRVACDRALAAAARYKHNVSVIAFDIDHFKLINDGHGHAAGDQVLADVTAACLACLRTADTLGRVGGEEFAVLLPHTDRQGALDVAEKLRGVVAGLPFEPDGQPCPVTASFGVATFDIATRDTASVLANADAALYQAKTAGRNRVVGWRAADNRSQQPARRRVFKAGIIHFNARHSTIDCTVRTLARDGAGLDVINALDLPDHFNLMIRSDGIDAPCRIVGRSGGHVEVEFVER